MSYKLTDGDIVFVEIHDKCPNELYLLLMDIISIYLTHFKNESYKCLFGDNYDL